VTVEGGATDDYLASTGARSPIVPSSAIPVPTVHLVRTVRFSAAHRYNRPEWSEERNRAAFGACANPHGHGHDYRLEVTVAGSPDPETGFAVELPALDRILGEEVIRRFDHQHINHAEADFGEGGLIPTTENLVIFLWDRLAPRVREAGAGLVRLRLCETGDLCAEYHGPEPGESGEGTRMA